MNRWKRRLGYVALAASWSSSPSQRLVAVAGTATTKEPARTSPASAATLDEIKAKAREEGEVEIVQWPGYAQLVDEFKQQTGCTVNTKDGADLRRHDLADLRPAEYDGVSASGNASVRLMARGDVAPVNPELIPNYADVQEGIKNQAVQLQGRRALRGAHGRGPNLLVFRTDDVTPAPDSWCVIWDENTPYKGKISIYDDSIFIADAALYLKATQPDLGIDEPVPAERRAVPRRCRPLKGLAPNVGEWWADYAKQIQSYANQDVVIGTTWPLQVNILKADKKPVEGDQAQGGHDRLVGHVDDLLEGEASELHVPLDGPHDLAGGAGGGCRGLRRGSGQPQGLRADEEPEPLRRVPRRRRIVVGRRLLLDDAHRRLWRRRWHVQDAGRLGERLDGDPRLSGSLLPGS